MSDYIVTARKWRPMLFEDVLGQGHVTQTLRNAIASGRLAHAYLFSGPRGVGKTTTARLLAKAINCRHPREANPDNECDICREITDGTSFDILEIDGASNRGIDEIRNLRESIRYAPAKAKIKVYIIDEVHMLTRESFNALLKTLEEPPPHVMFIFATTEIHKVPATILSRCQRFDFRRIGLQQIAENLASIARDEKITIDEESLLLVARKGDGSLRDAQSLFDQVVSLCGRSITHGQILAALNIVDQEVYFRVTDLIQGADARGALALVDELFRQGHDMKEFLSGLQEHLRNILVAKATGSPALIETSDVFRKRYGGLAEKFSLSDLLRFQRLVAGTESAIRWSAQPRYRLEADMVQLVALPRSREIAAILEDLEQWKQRPGMVPTPHTGAPQRSVPVAPAESAPGTVSRPAAVPAPARTTVPLRQPPRASSLSESEVRTRWEEYLAEVRRQRISLGSVAESAVLLGVRDGTIRLGCTSEFQVSSIQRNREFLADLARKVFGSPAKIETERIGEAPESGAGEPPGAPPAGGEGSPDHPIIAAMKRELGAEPLE
jgi:DNA polymerase-3 subunit gamma/tau